MPSFLSRSAFGAGGLALAILAGCASPPPPPAPAADAAPAAAPAEDEATTGTVTFTLRTVAVGIGRQWGSGTLTFRGQEYPVRIRGLSVVDVGGGVVTGSGRVRGLTDISQFPGNYMAVTAGAALAAGGNATTMRNQNGVSIDVLSTTKGARVVLAPSGVSVTFAPAARRRPAHAPAHP